MKVFPSNPTGGIPSYLAEVRSKEKRLALRNAAIAMSTRPGGFYPLCSARDVSSSYGADSDGLYFEQVSGTTILNDVAIYQSPIEEIAPHSDPLFITKFRVLDNTDIRIFVGMSTVSYTSVNHDDIISGDSVGFQFSSSRGDTNWQLVTNDDGTQTTTDSGLAFSTSQIYITEMEFSEVGTSVRFRISDENFDVLMGDTTVTSNIPDAASDLSPLNSLSTLATVAKTARFYWRESWY